MHIDKVSSFKMTNFQGNDYEKKLRLRGITVVFRHGERYFINYI